MEKLDDGELRARTGRGTRDKLHSLMRLWGVKQEGEAIRMLIEYAYKLEHGYPAVSPRALADIRKAAEALPRTKGG